jgi:hypothetical protein
VATGYASDRARRRISTIDYCALSAPSRGGGPQLGVSPELGGNLLLKEGHSLGGRPDQHAQQFGQASIALNWWRSKGLGRQEVQEAARHPALGVVHITSSASSGQLPTS